MARVVGFYTEKRHGRRKVHPITTKSPRLEYVTVHVGPTVAHRRKHVWVISEHEVPEHEVREHEMHTRSGRVVEVREHEVKEHEVPEHEAHARKKEWRVKGKKIRRLTIRFGGHFKEVAEKIAREYEKKGYPREEAERIGRATAAVVYRHKLALAYGGVRRK